MMDRRGLLLAHLRSRGRATAEELATALGVAPVTARHHLGRLRAEGMVDALPVRAGRGRPRHEYRLTARGATALTPERPFEFLVSGLIDVLRDDSSGAATRVLGAAAVRLAASRRSELAAMPIEQRLDAVVELLDGAGFAAYWTRDDEGYLLHEAGCPFGCLSDRYPEVCHMDLSLIRELLGPDVHRIAWRADGTAHCTYRVAPLDP